MDFVFTLIKNALFLFFGFIALAIVLTLLFGKRKTKRWDYEAEFHDERGREFGEFDIEMSKIEKEEADYTFKATLSMRHDSLVAGARVKALIDDSLVLEGEVEKAGRILLGQSHIRTPLGDAQEGQMARILVNDVEIVSGKLVRD